MLTSYLHRTLPVSVLFIVVIGSFYDYFVLIFLSFGRDRDHGYFAHIVSLSTLPDGNAYLLSK